MASALLLRTALTQIEQALHQVIRLKLLALRTTAADPAALRALVTQGASGPAVSPFAAVYVTSLGHRVEWSRASTATDNGTSVFKPTDVSGTPGRWLLTTSTATSGYLQSVNFWDGEASKEQFQARIFASRPSVAVVWESSDNEARSNTPGAIYDYKADFTIWCIDENLRPNYEAIFGSDISNDSAHPGAIAILGDVKKALADENKRIVDSTDSTSGPLSMGGGVKVIEIGGEAVEDADYDGRVMILSLAVTVHASVENQDASSEHTAITSVYTQPHLTKLNQQSGWDPNNYVIAGLAFDVQTGLTATPSAGSAVVSGTLLSGAPAAHTFVEFKDTYCDFSSGTLTYVAVDNNINEPATTSGALRVGMVVTDSVGITSYNPIAAVSAPFGSGTRVIPEPSLE